MSSRESYTSVINRKAAAKQQLMNVAMGRERADLVLKNAVYVNVFTNELSQGDIAVKNGVIAGIGHYDGVEELDMQGKIVAPGLIDAHIHLESSLVAPSEFVKAVLPHGTATVITDPHEIANVLGTDGIDYMIQATEGLRLKCGLCCRPVCRQHPLMNPGQDWIIRLSILFMIMTEFRGWRR